MKNLMNHIDKKGVHLIERGNKSIEGKKIS